MDVLTAGIKRNALWSLLFIDDIIWWSECKVGLNEDLNKRGKGIWAEWIKDHMGRQGASHNVPINSNCTAQDHRKDHKWDATQRPGKLFKIKKNSECWSLTIWSGETNEHFRIRERVKPWNLYSCLILMDFRNWELDKKSVTHYAIQSKHRWNS